ncbi:MAG: hypothetical protein Kow0068_09430 [Marinilabiliales bacterium]
MSPNGISDLYILNDYLYISGSDTTVRIFDISNPSNICQASYIHEDSTYSKGIKISNNYLFIACYEKGLKIYDISNPLMPDSVSTFILNGGFDAQNLSVNGDFVYVTDNVNLLHVINISTITNPVEVGSVQLSSTPGSIIYLNGAPLQVIGNFAYISNPYKGFQIIDVSDPSNPFIRGEYTSVGECINIHVIGNYAYITDYNNGLQVINISNPDNPVIAGYYYTNMTCAAGLYATSDYIYVGSNSGVSVFEFIPAGINSYKQAKRILFYPNPASETIFFNSDLSDFEIQIYDNKGIITFRKNIQNEKSLNISRLNSGFYSIKIIANDETYVSKLIIK